MKEFDNENYMNDQNTDRTESDGAGEKADVTPARNGEVHTPKTDMAGSYNKETEKRAEASENYYTEQRGDNYYRENTGYGSASSYNAQQYNNPAYNAQQYNGYNQNGANNGGYNNYDAQYDRAYNQYYQQQYGDYNAPRANNTDPYAGYTNSYVPNYEPPRQNGGNISYTPNGAKPKKEKEKKKKSASRTALILTCCLTVALSGFLAFVGTGLAIRVTQMNEIQTGETPGVSVGNSSGDGTVVIYKSPEDVDTSVDKADGEKLSYEDVAAAVKDSVVEITTEYNMQSLWYQYVTEGAGSGVIISEEGHIITNNHVICDEETGQIADSIKVRLTDGSEYVATVVGSDSISDIAILKINAEKLTVAVCGNSDELAVGEELIIVGNPLGSLGGTVTNGIVSATERTIQVNSVEMTLIQTNAAVNPGNSGGGMFNMMGQLVGIVNAKSSGTGIEGLGFAIPVNEALSVTEQLLEYGYVRGRTKLGVTFAEVQNSFFGGYYNLKDGVYASEVEKGYNDNVLKVGDRVIAVDGKEITSTSDIKTIVASASVGDVLVFQLYRNGTLLNVDVVCYESVPADIENNVQFEDFNNSENYPTGTMTFGTDGSGNLIPIE